MDSIKLKYYLNLINYNKETTSYLLNGFTNGFQLGSTVDIRDIRPNNSKNVSNNDHVVRSKLQKEIEAGRIKGPFSEPPFTPLHISPLNIREKKTPGKYRLIQNLSYPYDGGSINDNIPPDKKTVKYASVGDAIKILSSLPRHAYTAKTDIADAF